MIARADRRLQSTAQVREEGKSRRFPGPGASRRTRVGKSCSAGPPTIRTKGTTRKSDWSLARGMQIRGNQALRIQPEARVSSAQCAIPPQRGLMHLSPFKRRNCQSASFRSKKIVSFNQHLAPARSAVLPSLDAFQRLACNHCRVEVLAMPVRICCPSCKKTLRSGG